MFTRLAVCSLLVRSAVGLSAGAKQPLSICGLQLEFRPGDRAWNLEHAASLVRARPGHDLYVLPELSSCGYDDAVFARLDEYGEDVARGPSASFFARLAREVNAHFCYGIVRRVADGEAEAGEGDEQSGGRASSSPFRICQVVMGPDGEVRCWYDKMHLCHFGDCAERDHFGRGACAPKAFELSGWRLGLLICYDIRFPELCRDLAWRRGADVLLRALLRRRERLLVVVESPDPHAYRVLSARCCSTPPRSCATRRSTAGPRSRRRARSRTRRAALSLALLCGAVLSLTRRPPVPGRCKIALRGGVSTPAGGWRPARRWAAGVKTRRTHCCVVNHRAAATRVIGVIMFDRRRSTSFRSASPASAGAARWSCRRGSTPPAAPGGRRPRSAAPRASSCSSSTPPSRAAPRGPPTKCAANSGFAPTRSRPRRGPRQERPSAERGIASAANGRYQNGIFLVVSALLCVY